MLAWRGCLPPAYSTALSIPATCTIARQALLAVCLKPNLSSGLLPHANEQLVRSNLPEHRRHRATRGRTWSPSGHFSALRQRLGRPLPEQSFQALPQSTLINLQHEFNSRRLMHRHVYL